MRNNNQSRFYSFWCLDFLKWQYKYRYFISNIGFKMIFRILIPLSNILPSTTNLHSENLNSEKKQSTTIQLNYWQTKSKLKKTNQNKQLNGFSFKKIHFYLFFVMSIVVFLYTGQHMCDLMTVPFFVCSPDPTSGFTIICKWLESQCSSAQIKPKALQKHTVHLFQTAVLYAWGWTKNLVV